jgi:hypothetical protein
MICRMNSDRTTTYKQLDSTLGVHFSTGYQNRIATKNAKERTHEQVRKLRRYL